MLLIIKILGNLIPAIFGIIAIRKWRRAKLSKKEIGRKLGFIPFSKFQLLTGLLIGMVIFSLVFVTFLYADLLTITQFSWTNGNLVVTFLMLAAAAIGEEILEAFHKLIKTLFKINKLHCFDYSTFLRCGWLKN